MKVGIPTSCAPMKFRFLFNPSSDFLRYSSEFPIPASTQGRNMRKHLEKKQLWVGMIEVRSLQWLTALIAFALYSESSLRRAQTKPVDQAKTGISGYPDVSLYQSRKPTELRSSAAIEKRRSLWIAFLSSARLSTGNAC